MKSSLLVLLLTAAAHAQTAPRVLQSPTLPSDNLPIQRVGPDDLIGISTYDAPELTRTVRVGIDGAIRLPMVKERIHVAGLFPSEVEAAIAEELVKEEIMVDPIITVSVVESRSRPITVSGAVKNPTTFQASGQVTLLDALARANGLAEDAGPEILVSKNQPGPDGKPISLTQRIIVKALINGADPDLNLRLTGGEQVRIPEAGRVYVVGNVKKPGAFPLRDAGETSVLRALSLSEGLLPYTGEMAYIYRPEGGAGGKNEIPIDLKKIMDRKSPDVPLLANDILYVTDRSGRRSLARVMEIVGGGIGGALIYTTTR
ncbi:MAG TPA: polysaccharide biosynthesis/export family protein [Bryobacteraceae bacterium]|nr:polysaccharide biosynthesis/export family protein [Bryobacteraceae bacterium]